MGVEVWVQRDSKDGSSAGTSQVPAAEKIDHPQNSVLLTFSLNFPLSLVSLLLFGEGNTPRLSVQEILLAQYLAVRGHTQ